MADQPSVSKRELVVVHLAGANYLLETGLALVSDLITGAQEHEGPNGSGGLSVDLYMPLENRAAADRILAGWNAIEQGTVALTWSEVPDAAWELNWRDYFQPLPVSARITIVPEWDHSTSAALLIRLRPGNAFGTGHHSTTRLALTALEQLGCEGKRVLDLGSGSGVLSIAAAMLGARQVTAVESDPDCERNFSENLGLNHLNIRPRLQVGDIMKVNDLEYDLIAINIQRSVIFPWLKLYAGSSSTARIIVTGILLEEELQLLELINALHLRLDSIDREGEWICAVIARGQTGHLRREIN
ncbi:MAG: 50S ribosomal protein L11 methyltransferase [Candidatus Marinimicrobia bacterium]|nr:50S ribosomal protein L11 methyltransferase [Candidatus Neomarinimicrobiota bacterium]